MKQGQSAGMGLCPERNSEAGDSCCQHGPDDSGDSEKNSHHAKSCCPTEAAIAQKNSSAAAGLIAIHIAALTQPNSDMSGFAAASENADVSALWRAGRDILLQVHVLRIWKKRRTHPHWKSPCADDSFASLQLFPLLKGEDHEDFESSAVDGADRTRSRGDSKGGAGDLLPVGGLLRLVLRLQVRRTRQIAGA
jgi:hypothetical protein